MRACARGVGGDTRVPQLRGLQSPISGGGWGERLRSGTRRGGGECAILGRATVAPVWAGFPGALGLRTRVLGTEGNAERAVPWVTGARWALAWAGWGFRFLIPGWAGWAGAGFSP